MKKKTVIWLLAATCSISLCACGSQPPEISEPENASSPDTSAVPESEPEPPNEPEPLKNEFSFSDLENLEFWFCSGAGGWATIMTVEEDGSFTGVYFDGEMGATGPDYPNGTTYMCNFNGQFAQPENVNDYTWATQIAEINYEQTPGTEEIIDGMLYLYTDAYGLDGAEDILIYLPGAPLAELPQDFRSWIGYYDLSTAEETSLPFYALNNDAQQYGFTSSNIIENLMSDISRTETEAAELEASIENDPLTQTDYNEKSALLYDIWNTALNQTWAVLQKVLDEEDMERLTEEERAWINEKEQAAAEAGTVYEGGSMQSMAINMKAAEMTKERVYELLELL